MKSMKNWIVLLLIIQTLCYWRVCESSRVSVELRLRVLNYEGNCSSCTVTFCLQERDQGGELCPYGMISFVGDRQGSFGDESVIGSKNSTAVSNPLMFFVDQVRFDIRTSVLRFESNILIHTRSVNVRGDLDSVKRVTTTSSAVTLMIFSFLVRCDQMYYGSDCSRYCEETDDETGHFTCDRDGNPVCLPGYNHSSANDSRCTQCVENCTTTTTTTTTTAEGIDTTGDMTGNSQDTMSLPSGATAGIVISIMFVLAVLVVGGITALLLAMYRPWAADSKVNDIRSRSTSKALNNPIYEDETFNSGRNVSRNGTNVTSDGAADLRDLPFKDSSGRFEESSPLYASENMADQSQIERSVFVDNKALVGVLDLHPTYSSNPPHPQSNVVVDAKKGIATYDARAKEDTKTAPMNPKM